MAATCEHLPYGLSEAEMELMGRVPASFILTKWRQEMSRYMDVPCEVPDRDYRYFAEKNGLLPADWQWLDSQKIQGDASSFCKVLNHLIQKYGRSFTVLNVYCTFFEMNSAAAEVLLKAWPDIRKNYLHTEGRPGQENCEGSSCMCAVCFHNSHRCESAGSCLDQSFGVGSAQSITLNNAEPAYDSANLQGTYSPQFDSNNNVEFYGGTYEDNCLSLQKPESAGLHTCPCVMSIDLPLNITSKQQGESALMFGQPGAYPRKADGQSNSIKSQGRQERGVIFIPNQGFYLSLSTTPDNTVGCPQSFIWEPLCKQPFPWDRQGHDTELKKQHPSCPDAGRFNSAPACGTEQKPHESHRQQPLPGGKTTEESIPTSPQLQSNQNFKFSEKAKHFVLIISGDSDHNAASCQQVQIFCQVLKKYSIPHVAIVPAMKSPIVWLTAKQRKKLEHSSQLDSSFLNKCYAKAKKILIAVSPSFVNYADPYIKGNKPPADESQKFVQHLFKAVYEEHVGGRRETHRLWPVLLTKMNTDRQHIPWFLTQALYYYFPQKQGSEDVAELLQTEVYRRR